MLQVILLFNYIPRSYSVQRLSSIDPIVNRDGPSSPSMEMGRSRPINIWLSYIFTQNGFDDLENQNRRFQLRAQWLASNPIVNRVCPSSPSMEMGPSRLINIWLSCKFTQNGFHDSQNKNHRFQLRAHPLRSLEDENPLGSIRDNHLGLPPKCYAEGFVERCAYLIAFAIQN